MNKRTEPIIVALKAIIRTNTVSTQEEICTQLINQGFHVNQSKVSRLLRKVSALKKENEQGKIVYQLSKEPAPPPTQSPLANLVLDICANESLIVVRTSPGSASLIARMLDYHPTESQILATLAGDDTIFVTPKTIQNIQEALEEVKRLLAQEEVQRLLSKLHSGKT